MKKIQLWIIIILLVLIAVFGMIYYNKKSSGDVDLAPPECTCTYKIGDLNSAGFVITAVDSSGCNNENELFCSSRTCIVEAYDKEAFERDKVIRSQRTDEQCI